MYAILCYAAAAACFTTASPLIGLAALLGGTAVQCVADRWLNDRE